jgi:hypothetical protein
MQGNLPSGSARPSAGEDGGMSELNEAAS